MNYSAGARRAIELIQRELQSCCLDYDTLKRAGQIDAQSAMARAIDLLRPSMGAMAQQRALELVNHYARQAIAFGSVSKAEDDVLFCLACGWTGERWETTDDDCPGCRLEGSRGRLREGNPTSRFCIHGS
ncbi:MAG: hypothetical protein WBL23_13450 [Salinisphaera sp.]